jgi:hypothetical protein
MADLYNDYLKKKKELQKQETPTKAPLTNDIDVSTTPQNSLYDSYLARKQEASTAGYNPSFTMLGKTYVSDKNGGGAVKINPYSYQPTAEEKARDEARVAATGHETFGTDLGQALSGGAQSWAANQLSTAATLGLAYEGLRNKDNYYQPEAGSTLWKMLQASSANTRQANALMEDSKKGRGKAGQLIMDVGSQAVMNGIDAALKSIPGVGQVVGGISFASRSFGGSAQQARDEGKSIATQVLRGGVSAAIESATEAMWSYGGVRSYGTGQILQDTGILGGLTNTLEAAIAKRAGPVIGKIAVSFGTEAVEEMLADVLNPVVSSAIEHFTKDSKLFNDYEAEEWQGIGNMLYDGLVGGISGIGGGIVESAGAVNTYKNNAGSNNELYATILRQQYESARADAKNANAAARAVRRQSIADAVDTLFSNKTGRSVVERASEAAGRLVSRKEAFSLAGNMSEDLAGIYHDIAKNFAENNVANEVINKKVLENAVFNYLSTGEFANELNSVDDARTQIQALSKNIMAEYIADLQNNAKGKHNKLKQEFYGSILSRLMNESFASEQANNQTVAEEDVEATSFRIPMADIEADRAARAAAQNPVEDVDVPTQTFESERQPTTITAEENAQLTDEQKAKRFIASGNNVIRIEGGNRQGATTQGRQLFTAIAQEAQRQGKVAELVYNEGAKEWQAIISDAPTAEQADANEGVNTESVEAEQPAALTKNDKQKINRLFSNKQKSVKIGSDAHSNLLLETIRQRAEINGVEVVVKNGKVRLAVKGESDVTQELDGQSNVEERNLPKESIEETEPVTETESVQGKPEITEADAAESESELESEALAAEETKAEEPKEIRSFTGDYSFLSNKYRSDIYFADLDKTFKSVNEAMRDSSVKARYSLRDVVLKKFQQDTELRDRLFATTGYTLNDGSNLGEILSSVRDELSAPDSPYNNRLNYLDAARSGSFLNELKRLNEIEAEENALAEQRKESLLSKFRGEKNNEQNQSANRDEPGFNNVGDAGQRRSAIPAKTKEYSGRLPAWTNREGIIGKAQSDQVTVEQRTFSQEGQAVLQNDKGKFLKDGDWVYAYRSYRILKAITGSVGDYINRMAKYFGNNQSTILVGGEGLTVVGNWSSTFNGVSTSSEIAVSLSPRSIAQGINTWIHENTHYQLFNHSEFADDNSTESVYNKAKKIESIVLSAGKRAGLSKLAVRRILGVYYYGAYEKTFKVNGQYQEFQNYFKKNRLNFDDNILSLCAEEFCCDLVGNTSNLSTVINWLDKTDTKITNEQLLSIRQQLLSELINNGVYTEDQISVINQAVIDSAAGDFVGLNSEYGNVSQLYENVLESKPSSNAQSSTKKASQSIGNRNRLEQQNERTFDDAEEERRTMSDDEYWERRRADKDTPTVQDFERQKEQAAAAKEMSPSEAWDFAEKSFGKGHKRVTRAVRNFMKGESPFTGENANKFGAKGKQIADKLGKMVDALANVNDGYGTIQEVADMYREWRDDNSMKDYWSEEVQDRFTKMLDDADAVEWSFEPRQQAEISQAFEEAVNAMKANISNADASTTRLISLAGEAAENRFNLPKNSLVSKAVQKFIRMQISTDTAMKMFGGFKGSGQFYKLNQDIKDSVAKRMTTFIEAYNYFDDVKQMEGFAEFAADTKKYKLDSESEFLEKYNPFKDKEFTLQQILAIRRLFATLQDTVKHSEVKLGERINGFLIRDANGNSEVVHIDEDTPLNRENAINAIMNACNNILLADNPAAKAAIAYSHACDEMFASLGKQVSDVRKAVTGNGISLIGDNYTPLLWANEDGSEANYTFFEDERLRPPGFLYKRTQNAGTLVVSPISYIVDKYIERASDYVGTAKMKDILSRLNAGTSINAETKGLNATLAENFGEEAGKWFNEYVKDLTMYGQNDSIFAELRRRLQTGALIGSPSVMMKQTSSYWSAMGLLSPEALVQAYRWKVGVKAQDSTELNPLLKYRRLSNKIDPTLTDIMNDVQRYGKISNSKVFKLFTNGISEQDFKTVDNLYTATVYDTILKNRNASYLASEQFQKDVDAKFMEVMLRSQPMFDTELRAEYARTDNELVKMTSMFRTQQTQNLNLIATALGEYNASKGTAESADKLQTLQRTLAGQATAALSLSLLTLAADVLLHGLRKYRDEDDDDKIKAEKILGRIGLNTIETISGTVWFGDYASKWLIDQLSGGDTKEFYGVNFGPVTTLQNILDSVSYTIQSPTASNIKNCVTYISQAMGIPLNNAYRILNSAAIYFCDMIGQNPSNYDDILKKWNNDVSVSDKVKEGRNLLIDYGMSKKEATSFVKGVDVDNNGLSQQEVKDYYVAHPEDADKVNILWDSMGWSQPWSKAQKSLDKKIQYNSNPLYAKMDEDESGSVSKSEAMDYYLSHKDEKADIEKAYDALGFSTSFKSAVKSAEAAEQKEIAEEAFNSGNYNVLFETVSGMKNGKSFLTNLIRDETGDEDTPSSNLLFGYLTQAKLDASTMDTAVASFAGEKLLGQYQKLRGMGFTPSDAISRIDDFDVDDNGGITQAELAEYYKAHPGDENIVAEFWSACGWKKSWADYKKSKKIA